MVTALDEEISSQQSSRIDMDFIPEEKLNELEDDTFTVRKDIRNLR